jgi:hypothetical protein
MKRDYATGEADNIQFFFGKEIEKTIFQDKEWRYYGNSNN